MRLPGGDRMAGSRRFTAAMARRGRRGTDDAARRLHGGASASALLGGNASRALMSIFPGSFADGPWLIALALLLGLWELATAKLNLLPRPFFAAPQSLLEVYTDDWPRLGESTAHSVMLLVTGYAVGAVLGFISGVAIGWSRAIGYWLHPVLRFIGPLPATAWLPLAFFVFPSSWSAERVSDRAGDRIPGHRVDLVRRGERQRRLLRRRANAWRPSRLSDPQGRYPGRDAVGVRRALHGSRRVVRGAGRGGDDGREGGSRLVPELGTRLGRLFQHVRGADRDGADVQRPDHAAVPPARSAAVLAERVCCDGSSRRRCVARRSG